MHLNVRGMPVVQALTAIQHDHDLKPYSLTRAHLPVQPDETNLQSNCFTGFSSKLTVISIVSKQNLQTQARISKPLFDGLLQSQ